GWDALTSGMTPTTRLFPSGQAASGFEQQQDQVNRRDKVSDCLSAPRGIEAFFCRTALPIDRTVS
ncbi:MAG: hypothetical protein WA750_02070, partial [Pseudolabrys sp.]